MFYGFLTYNDGLLRELIHELQEDAQYNYKLPLVGNFALSFAAAQSENINEVVKSLTSWAKTLNGERDIAIAVVDDDGLVHNITIIEEGKVSPKKLLWTVKDGYEEDGKMVVDYYTEEKLFEYMEEMSRVQTYSLKSAEQIINTGLSEIKRGFFQKGITSTQAAEKIILGIIPSFAIAQEKYHWKNKKYFFDYLENILEKCGLTYKIKYKSSENVILIKNANGDVDDSVINALLSFICEIFFADLKSNNDWHTAFGHIWNMGDEVAVNLDC